MGSQNVSLQNQTLHIFNGSSPVNNYTDHDDEIIAWMDFNVTGILISISAFIGIVGNALSCVVLFQLSKISSFYLYLAFLALSDKTVLIASGIFNLLYMFEFGFNQSSKIGVFCTWHFAMVLTFSNLSSWITVAVTIDRYIAVCHPFNANKYCTKRLALIYICTAFLVIVVVKFPIICLKWEEEGSSCVLPEFTKEYCFKYNGYINMFGCVLIPFCLICALNTLTIRGIYNAASRRLKMTAGNENAASSISNMKDSTLRTVTMLFTVTAFFIVTCLPFVIMFVYEVIHNISVVPGTPVDKTVVYMASHLKHSLNFVLYGLSGKRFRDKFLETLRCRRFVGRSQD